MRPTGHHGWAVATAIRRRVLLRAGRRADEVTAYGPRAGFRLSQLLGIQGVRGSCSELPGGPPKKSQLLGKRPTPTLVLLALTPLRLKRERGGCAPSASTGCGMILIESSSVKSVLQGIQ